MELMIVLLVVSIIAAATAPMIARKSARSARGSGSAVGYLGIGDNFGNNGGGSLILGDTQNYNSKLYVDLDGKGYHIGFGNNGLLGYLKIGDNHGVVLGSGNASATGQNSIAIGTGAIASGENSIAIGNGANTGNNANYIAIGVDIPNTAMPAIETPRNKRIVLGDADTDVVIPGRLIPNDIVLPEREGTITLGGPNSTVVIQGHLAAKDCLVFGGQELDFKTRHADYSGYKATAGGLMFLADRYSKDNETAYSYLNKLVSHEQGSDDDGLETTLSRQTIIPDWAKPFIKNADGEQLSGKTGYPDKYSDRRLKNVGEKFTGGLEEIKKLDLYNFTFKSDKTKTPQVGVMAQDLQKVFPNSVWEGADKYLRIRWDEMFYAVINAVRELDTKITEITTQVKANMDLITNMQAQIDEQKQEIQDLKAKNLEYEKQNAEILKRISKLEKRKKKSE